MSWRGFLKWFHRFLNKQTYWKSRNRFNSKTQQPRWYFSLGTIIKITALNTYILMYVQYILKKEYYKIVEKIDNGEDITIQKYRKSLIKCKKYFSEKSMRKNITNSPSWFSIILLVLSKIKDYFNSDMRHLHKDII